MQFEFFVKGICQKGLTLNLPNAILSRQDRSVVAKVGHVITGTVFFKERHAFFGTNRCARADLFLKTSAHVALVSANNVGSAPQGNLYHSRAVGMSADLHRTHTAGGAGLLLERLNGQEVGQKAFCRSRSD